MYTTPEEVCWYKECETLYRSFIRAPVGSDSDRASSFLLSRLEQKKQERWEEAANSIDFIPSNFHRTIPARHGAPSINLLASLDAPLACAPSRQTPSPRNSWKNGAHRNGGREPTRLVNKELSDLWKIPTPEGYSISEPFRSEELAAALKHLKPRKSPGLDSIFLEFILHAGSALKSWFCDFLTSCMPQLKIAKIWRPKPEKP